MDVKIIPDEELLSSNTEKNSNDGGDSRSNMNDIRNENHSVYIKCDEIVNHDDVMNDDKDHNMADELIMDIKTEPDDELLSPTTSKNSYDGDNHQNNTKDIWDEDDCIDIKYDPLVNVDEIIIEDNYNVECKQITSKFPSTGTNSTAFFKLPLINNPQHQSLLTSHIDDIYVKPELLLLEVVAVILVKKCTFHKRNFVCSVCFDIFRSSYLLKRHKTVHSKLKSVKRTRVSKLTTKKSTRCDSKSTCSSKTVEVERVPYFNVNPYKCDKCDSEFKRASLFKLHQRIHSNDKPFKCDQCNYKGRSAPDLGRHSELHNSDSPFKCDICNFATKRAYRLKDHKLTHSTDKPFKCDQCDFQTVTAWCLKSHQLRHNLNKRFECDKCSYKTGISCNLKLHQATHSASESYECDECYLKFTSVGILKEHQITIHNGKRFKCDKCDAKFKLFFTLKQHKLLHSSERPFECDKCNYTCKTSKHLTGHSMSHKSKNEFKCDQCSYETKYLRGLKRHQLTHSRERPFRCGHCDYASKTKADLKSHIKCVHKTIP